jgi:hypothetical protein
VPRDGVVPLPSTGDRPMLDPIGLLTDAVVQRVLAAYEEHHAGQEPAYPQILESESRTALSEIARGDALYHDVHHTAMVTDAGLVILKGRWLNGRPVAPRDWLHCVLAMLFHDIGIVGGVCQADREGVRATGLGGGTIRPPRGTTDAYLAPYHVDRGLLYVRERFAGHEIVDPEVLAANIDRTRFPVPGGADYQCSSDMPGLVRAADLIGQLGDPDHGRKLPALFYEFEEIGANAELGFSNPDDLRADYPRFFWKAVAPFVKEALADLQAAEEGKRWIAGLLMHLPGVERVEEILAKTGSGPDQPAGRATSSSAGS